MILTFPKLTLSEVTRYLFFRKSYGFMRLNMKKKLTDTSDDDHDIWEALEAMEAALGHIIKTNPL